MIKRMKKKGKYNGEKDKKKGQISAGLLRLSGAVRFNLVWAGRIAKEQ